MKIVLNVLLICTLAGIVFLSACVQMPTEKHGMSDLRAQIAFKPADERTRNATVLIDGLNMGPVANYLDGVASLRLLPGTHVLVVVSGAQVILEERFYAGDGVSRTFILQ